MLSKLLSEFVVQFVAQGTETIQASTERVKDTLVTLGQTADIVGRSIDKSLAGAVPTGAIQQNAALLQASLSAIAGQAEAAGEALGKVSVPAQAAQRTLLPAIGTPGPGLTSSSGLESALTGLTKQLGSATFAAAPPRHVHPAHPPGSSTATTRRPAHGRFRVGPPPQLPATPPEFGTSTVAAEAVTQLTAAAQATNLWTNHNSALSNSLQQITRTLGGMYQQLIPTVQLATEPKSGSFFDKLTASLAEAQKGVTAFGGYAAQAFDRLTGSVMGWVQAGLAGSMTGDMLNLRMTQLAQAIGGLFRPEIDKIIGRITQLNDWIRSLTDAQKESIVHWIEAAAAGLGMAAILPRVVAGIEAAIGATKALGVAIGLLEAETAIGLILPVIGAIVAGVTALAVGTETGCAGIAAIWEALKPVVDAVKELGAKLADAFGPVMQKLIAALGERIKAFVIDPLVETLHVITEIVGSLQGLFMALKESFSSFERDHPWLAAIAKGTFNAMTLGVFGGAWPEKEPKQGDPRRPLTAKVSGFESIASSWDRIAAQAREANGPEVKQVDLLKLLNDGVGQVVQLMNKREPEAVR